MELSAQEKKTQENIIMWFLHVTLKNFKEFRNFVLMRFYPLSSFYVMWQRLLLLLTVKNKGYKRINATAADLTPAVIILHANNSLTEERNKAKEKDYIHCMTAGAALNKSFPFMFNNKICYVVWITGILIVIVNLVQKKFKA